VIDPADFSPELPAPPRERAAELGGRVVERPDERSVAVAPLTHLPATAASQLSSLVQTLELHPGKPRTVAFVASGRGEGTTTCVANFGSYLAKRKAKVLMVDANLHAAALHAIGRVAPGPGLAELITGSLDLRSAIQPTTVPNLHVLTSGQQAFGANGYLIPTTLWERVFDCTRDYDFVLVDCPAVNVYEDAALIAAICDAVILVIEGGKTVREQAQASKALLLRAQCRMLGIFLNKRKLYVPQFIYDRL